MYTNYLLDTKMVQSLQLAKPVEITSISGVLTLTADSNSFIAGGDEAITTISGGADIDQGIYVITWNTVRTLTYDAAKLQLIGKADRITTVGDVGFYQINGAVVTELAYTPIGGYADKAYSTVLVDGTKVNAESPAATLELIAGTNIALTPDAVNKSVTIAVTGKVASAAHADTADEATNAAHADAATNADHAAMADNATNAAHANAADTATHANAADTATTAANCTGNAATATKLETARNINVTGDATGSAVFDGSADVTIAVDVHNADNAARLENAHTINGVAFDGTKDIIIKTEADGGNSDTVGGYYPQDLMPLGAIVMWSGSIASIPSKWNLCDGTNGTPDLRNRFVVGAGSDNGIYTAGANGIGTGNYKPGDIGGQDFHQLTVDELAKHSHHYKVYDSLTDTQMWLGDVGTKWYGHSSTTDVVGNDKPHENRPPYYALAYIMRIS